MEEQKPLTLHVYNSIYNDIINGVLCSNDIITENKLIALYGVSKSPVREALISLCDEKVLQSIPRTGYQVVQLMPSDVVQLTEARQALELFMLEKSFPTLTSEQIDQLKECDLNIERMSQVSPFSQRWRDNMQFHLILASFANNKYMYSMLEEVLRSCARASTQYFAHSDSDDYRRDLHQRMIDACIEKDLEKARQVIISDTDQIRTLLRGL